MKTIPGKTLRRYEFDQQPRPDASVDCAGRSPVEDSLTGGRAGKILFAAGEEKPGSAPP